MTNSVNAMRIAGMLLAITMCGAARDASAQQVFFNVGGSGSGSSKQAPGSAGLGTAGLGLGGFGSATQNLDENAGAGFQSGSGLKLPLLDQGADNALGVTGGAGAAQGSLSSAIDRPSSPIDSVTNSLMGSVRTAVTRPQEFGAEIRPASESRKALPRPPHRVTAARPSPPRPVPPKILERFGAADTAV